MRQKTQRPSKLIGCPINLDLRNAIKAIIVLAFVCLALCEVAANKEFSE